MWPCPYLWPVAGAATGTLYDWPDPDPEGPLLVPLTKLVTLIAASPVFRARCGLETDDPDANDKLIEGQGGTKRIFYPAADLSQWDVFPAAVVQFGPEWTWDRRAGGHRNFLLTGGSLRLILLDEAKYMPGRGPGDIERSLRDFSIFVGNLFADLASAFGLNDELDGVSIRTEDLRDQDGGSMDGGPKLCPLTEEVSRGRAYWHATYLVEWQ